MFGLTKKIPPEVIYLRQSLIFFANLLEINFSISIVVLYAHFLQTVFKYLCCCIGPQIVIAVPFAHCFLFRFTEAFFIVNLTLIGIFYCWAPNWTTTGNSFN